MRKILYLLSLGILFSCQTTEEKAPESPLGWEVFETPVKASLRGLSPVTAEIAWAAGSGGTWLRTIDGGQNWDYGVVAELDTVDFRSIHAFDAMKAVVVSAGQPSVIYKTEDGGKTWKLKHQELDEAAFLDGITFTDEENGFVIGDPLDGKWTILKTANQGDSWYSLLNLPAAEDGEAAFAASATSLIADGMELWLGTGGVVSKLYYSPDLGETWEEWKSPFMQGESTKGIFSLTSLGKGEVFAVGGDYVEMADTTSTAASFVLEKKEWVLPKKSTKGYRSGVAYFSKLHWLVAVGPTGSDYSKDGGMSWENFSEVGFHSVKIGHTDAAIWASGSEGRIARLMF